MEPSSFGLSLLLSEQEVSVSAETRMREESSLRVINFYPQGVGSVQILNSEGGKLVFGRSLTNLFRAESRPIWRAICVGL